MPRWISSSPSSLAKSTLVLALTGLALWLGGAVAALLGHAALGATLRCIALVLFAVAILPRSTLMLWTFLAMLAGVEIGLDAPRFAVETHFLGELFLRLIRMIVAPLIFASITTGIAAHGHLRSVGRIAVKSLIYFEVVTTLGLILGTVAMNLSGAGWGIALPRAVQDSVPAIQAAHTWQLSVVNLFPENIAQAVAQNQILQVAIFSLLFGAALAMLSQSKRAPLLSVLQSLAEAMFQLTRIIMFLAPLAAGAALAYSVASMGLAALLTLGKLVLTFYAALTAFCLFVLIPILLLFRIPMRRFVAAVGEPAAIGFATTTSEAALPLAMERMEEFGVPRWIVSFVIPMGYSFNMDGASVYLAMASIFAAQASGIHLSLGQQIAMLATLILASKGVTGVPRATLVVLLATASAIHIPTSPVLLILGVDTLMDMGRTMINIVGNCMASAVIARSESCLLDSSTLPRTE